MGIKLEHTHHFCNPSAFPPLSLMESLPFCAHCSRELTPRDSGCYECPCGTDFTHVKEPTLAYSEERWSKIKVVVRPKRELSDENLFRIDNKVEFLCNFSNYQVKVLDTGELFV